MPPSAAVNYHSYLALDEILGAQRPRSEEHDELLFIVVHQVYELWFKQLLHEGAHLQEQLEHGHGPRAGQTMRRILTILRTIVTQLDVLETLTPVQYTGFRGRLETASGFQSAQFREIEFLCGAQKTAYLRFLEPTAAERVRLEERLARPTLYDALKGVLGRRGFAVSPPEALVQTFRTIYERDEEFYDLYLLLEEFIEFDERFLLWRGRHVRMVERMIGMKPGTGGSLGVAYLEKTLSKKFFPELWEVRTYLGGAAYGRADPPLPAPAPSA